MRLPFNLGDSSHRDPEGRAIDEQSLVQIREKMLTRRSPIRFRRATPIVQSRT